MKEFEFSQMFLVQNTYSSFGMLLFQWPGSLLLSEKSFVHHYLFLQNERGRSTGQTMLTMLFDLYFDFASVIIFFLLVDTKYHRLRESR